MGEKCMKKYTCCFLGHRRILETPELKNKIRQCIEKLILDYGVSVFLFGSKSEFTHLCYTVVTELKEIYPYIIRIYIRAEFPNISCSYREYLFLFYEDTYYPEKIKDSGSAVYVERNREMIDRSSFCVFYYNDLYNPNTGKSKKSGTALAYSYAKRKKLTVFNLFGDDI